MMVRCEGGLSDSLQVGRTSVAVTAVTILENGSVIAAYSSYLKNLDTDQRLKVFKHQAVHLLSLSNFSLLACGGRSICKVDLSHNDEMSVSCPERRLKDWIISAAWISDTEIAVLFSYNSVAILDSTLTCSRSVQCDSCCIIYGGCLVVEDNVLLCCSGTVFNKPLLWKPLQSSHVVKSYEGHSGVIFDIKLTESKLFSVSDDRTLIIWDRLSGDIQHRLFGHTARILKVVLMPWCEGVVTVGEDNQVIVWSRGSGEKISSFTPHTGNGIRAVHATNNTLVTGGWDSTVVKFTFSNKISNHQQEQCLVNLVDDPPKWVSWTEDVGLLVQLASGELRLYNDRLDSYKVVMSAVDSGFKDYSKSCKIGNVLVIGGRTGYLCVLDCKNMKFSTVSCCYETKIFSLTTVACKGKNLFLSCHESGCLTLWQLNQNLSAEPIGNFTLPKCKSRWLTSACVEESGKCLLVGDRRGGVHLYHLTENISSNSEAKVPASSIAGLHGENGISQIISDQKLVLTVGRDGNVRYLKIKEECLVIVKKHKPMSGVYWIEKMEQRDGLTVMYYFHGQQFKVTVLEAGETVFSVECGGGHRSWDVVIDGETLSFAYINNPKVKTVKQKITFNILKRYGTINHGSEIHSAVYHKDLVVTGGEDCTLIAFTEDTAVQISGHISSVRSLCLTHTGILFSAGGRGSLKAWEIPADRVDLELVSDYAVVSNSHIPVGYNSSYRFDQRNSDNDQRVMSVDCCVSAADRQYRCFVACGLSNGEVYLLGYTPDNKFIKLLSDCQENCITRVKLIETCPETGALLLLLSTTFGMVHGLNIRDIAIDGRFSYRLHSSGINGLDVRLGASAQVLTIGDDGDVIRSTLSASGHGLASILPVARRTTHFSAGIAVKFLISDRAITVGSDQRLFILDLYLNPVYCCYVDVPDPHDLVISNAAAQGKSKVLVCGKGLQEFMI